MPRQSGASGTPRVTVLASLPLEYWITRFRVMTLFVGRVRTVTPHESKPPRPFRNAAAGDAGCSDQLLRRPSAARFHCETLSAIMRVDFIAAWLSWA